MSFHTIICYPLLYYSTEFHHSTSIGWAPWLCNSPLCMVRSQYSARWLQPERSAGSDLMGNFDHIFWEIYSGYDTVWDANMVSYDMISSLPGISIVFGSYIHPDMIWCDLMWYDVLWCDMICISHHGDLLNISQDICMVFEVIWYDPWNAEHCDWPSWMEWRSLFSGTKNYIRMWCICWYS